MGPKRKPIPYPPLCAVFLLTALSFFGSRRSNSFPLRNGPKIQFKLHLAERFGDVMAKNLKILFSRGSAALTWLNPTIYLNVHFSRPFGSMSLQMWRPQNKKTLYSGKPAKCSLQSALALQEPFLNRFT